MQDTNLFAPASVERGTHNRTEPMGHAIVLRASMFIGLFENFYLMNRCFLKPNQLLDNASRLRGIPTFIANGRLDMLTPPVTAWQLSQRIPNAKLEILPANGHVDLGVALTGVRATDSLAGFLPAARP
ncbi:MAG TPA: hypothetical protein VF981_09335 [Gemmatimonadaceae bacterium]